MSLQEVNMLILDHASVLSTSLKVCESHWLFLDYIPNSKHLNGQICVEH